MLLTARLMVCDRVLAERDNVTSLIRLVDLFLVAPGHQAPVVMNLYISCVFSGDDVAQHEFSLSLRRPDGQLTPVALPVETCRFSFGDAIESKPKGYVFAAPWAVLPTQMGNHELLLAIDGAYYQSAYFTLELWPESE